MKVKKKYKRIRINSKKLTQRLAESNLSSIKLKNWSREVRGRDSYTCKNCGSKIKSQAHHLISKLTFINLAYNINIGITLCRPCHIGYGGVHRFDTKPKNEFIKTLRMIHRKKDPKLAMNFLSSYLKTPTKQLSIKPRVVRSLYKT